MRRLIATCLAVLCVAFAGVAQTVAGAGPAQTGGLDGTATTVRLYGYVTEPGGEPLDGIMVDLWADGGPDLAHVTTGDGGYYEVDLPRYATYGLRFSQWMENGPYAYHKYLPAVALVSPAGASAIRRDMALKPAANLILEIYDGDAQPVRYGAFDAIQRGYFFVTTPNDLPLAWEANAVQDDYFRTHGGDWALALPTLLLTPDQTVRLHLTWNVPQVGELIVDVDGGADGYILPGPFGYLLLNLNREMAASAVNRLAQEVATFSGQGYALSPAVTAAVSTTAASLAAGDAHWAAEPREVQSALANWEAALSAALLAQERVYLEKAEADIPRHRQGTLALSLRDESGRPIAGAAISHTQRARDFLFSGGMLNDGYAFVPEIADRMQEMGVNAAAVAMSFGGLEPAPGVFDWSYTDQYSGLAQMLERGLSVNAAVALWHFPLYDWECPAYWRELTWEQYKALVLNHFQVVGARYGSRMNPWMFNEPTTANCLNLTWEQRLELVQVMMDGLHAADPAPENLLTALAMPYGWSQEPVPDEGNLPDGLPFPVYLDQLVARGLPPDNIGLEMHFFGVTVPAGGGYAMPGMTLAGLARLLDRYDAYGVPLWIEPFQVPSTQVSGSAWWHQPWDEATQAEFAVAFYTLAFGRKNVHDICWSDATDRAPFVTGAGLLDADLQPKPAYHALRALLASWTTRGSGVTDENGELAIRGYGGEYDLEITTPSGVRLSTTAHIYEQRHEAVTLTQHQLYLPHTANGWETDKRTVQ